MDNQDPDYQDYQDYMAYQEYQKSQGAPVQDAPTQAAPAQEAPAQDAPAPQPDNSALKNYINTNLKQLFGKVDPSTSQPMQAKGFGDAFMAGIQGSSGGLMWRGKLPDTVLPEHASLAMNIASQIGQFAGDVPAFLSALTPGAEAGGAAGAVAGGVIGSVVPGAGTLAGGAVGATIGAGMGGLAAGMAAPAAIRKLLTDEYQKGSAKTAGEFVSRLMAAGWEGAKGATTGAATALVGPVAEGASELAGPAISTISGKLAELGTMSAVGAGLEGHLPNKQDFTASAIVLGGLSALTHVASKLMNIYAATGVKPAEIVDEANKNVDLKQQLLSTDPSVPAEAQPTELKHFSEYKGEGATDEWIRHDLGVNDGEQLYYQAVKNGMSHGNWTLTPQHAVDLAQHDFGQIDKMRVANSDSFSEPPKVLPNGLVYDDNVKPLKEYNLSNLPANESPEQPQVATSKPIDPSDKDDFSKLASSISNDTDKHILPEQVENEIDRVKLKIEDNKNFPQSDEITSYIKSLKDGTIEQKLAYQEIIRRLKANGIPGFSFDEHPIEPTSTVTTPDEPWKLAPKSNDLNKESENETPANRTPEEQEILSKIGKEAEWQKDDRFNEWRTKNIDYTDPAKVAEQIFSEKTGKTLSAEDSPHVQMRLFAGHVDELRQILEHGFQDENGKSIGEGLNEIYKDVPNNDQTGFDLYSLAKRAIELDDRGKTPWKDFDREKAEKVVEDGKDKFEDLHQRRVKFQNQVIDYGVDKGVIDPDVAEKVKDQNQEYVPFNRIVSPDELTGETIGSGKLLKKIEGSERELANPRESIYQNTAAIIRRAQINEIRLKFMDNLSEVDEDGNKTNEFVREVKVPPGGIRDNQIAIFRDGKMSALEGTPLVIDSLKRLEGDKTMSDFVTKIARGFATSLRVGTVADPGFGLRHFFRSSIMSGVFSQTRQIPFLHPVMNLGEFMKGDSETFNNWLRDGGAVTSLDSLESSYIKNDIQAADAKYPFLNKAWNAVTKPFQAAETFIRMSDNLTRFTEYKRALEQGKSRDEAALLSRDVTPDYQKMGLQRSALRTSVAFIGAHINSLDRMAQAFKEDPQGTILRMSVLSGVSLATWLAYHNDKDIQDLHDYKKDLYWNFKVPDSHTVISLPKPWAPGILFGSGVERGLEAFFGSNPHAMKGFAKSIYESVVPNITPTMVAPILDQMANKNMFSGRQLVSEQQQKLLPEMQYQPYTSDTARAIGRLIGYVPFVKDIGPSSDPLASSEVVENYVRGWTGTAGGWALRISDAALHAAGVGRTHMHDIDTICDAPIANEFCTRFPNFKTQSIQDFYDNKNQADKILNSIKAAAKSGDMDAAAKISQANPEMQVNLDGIAKGISNIRKVIMATQVDPKSSPVEKRQLVDTLLFQAGSMAKMGNQMVDDFQKQVKH